ncbi:hypothetical protein RQP46_003737 [Phenoliferia psychrophenolica]
MLFRPTPAPPHVGPQSQIPDVEASLFSRTTFGWTWPLLKIGLSRPLQPSDLYELDPPRLASTVGLSLERNFYARVPPSRRPFHLRPSPPTSPSSCASSKAESYDEVPPPSLVGSTIGSEPSHDDEEEGREGGTVMGSDGIKYDQSLSRALLKTFAWPFYTSGVFLVFSALLQTLSPLVTKQLLLFITRSYAYETATVEQRYAADLRPPGPIRYGVGLAFGLFVMQEAASLFQNQYMHRGLTVGMLMRTSLIANISRKSLRLSGAARVKHPNGHLITLVSSGELHVGPPAHTEILVAEADPASLWCQPLQILLGVALLLAYLGSSALIGVIVLNTPIQSYLVRSLMRSRKGQLQKVDHRVRLIQEVLNGIRVVKLYAYETFFLERITKVRQEELASLRSIGIARASMSSSMSFVPIAAAILTFVTYSLTGHSLDAPTIFASLQLFNVIRQPLTSLPKALAVTSDAYVALQRITRALLAEELDGETPIEPYATAAIRASGDFSWETSAPPESSGGDKGRSVKAEKAEARRIAEAAKAEKRLGPPTLPQLLDEKSSLLGALIGEMKKVDGHVVFGGTTSYSAQSPWVQNATLRDNILFGAEYDEARFEETIRACALEPDIAALPHGVETEIGEKGINLSGGQKTRVCLARATYFNADIVLLDDVLSDVDAHVSKHLVDECLINGPLGSKTRILVTHSLEVLPRADHIIMMESGTIVEQGTYEDLVKGGNAFANLVAEYGAVAEKRALKTLSPREMKAVSKQSPVKAVIGGKLMEDEERETGGTSYKVYSHYLRSLGTIWWGPILLIVYASAQAFAVGTTVFLGLWTSSAVPGLSSGGYMGIYASMGVASGFFTPMHLNQLAGLVFSVLAAIGLVFYTYPLLGIVFVPLFSLYLLFSWTYRASSREIKRIDSIQRSYIYSSFGEMIGGMASIRAFRSQDRFVDSTERAIDVENQAYYLRLTLQRWLGVRLDFLGNILILGIALFGVGYRETISPAKLGVVLTYALSVTQGLSQLVSVVATVEQDMNTVERVMHYAHLPEEGALIMPNDPPPSWPGAGAITFTDVKMRYRDGLPEVLRGVSFKTFPGEKVGIVGRTICEVSHGSIEIDGHDISRVGLDVLRKRLSVIPQDPLLYAGTVRQNLDPTGEHDDAALNDALRRAGLIAPPDASDFLQQRFEKFKLDADVKDEGSNFSGGERQLVALCRAVVKNSRVLVLDEATSSVDVGTDAFVQRAIQSEFRDQSILCIAHRLATIVSQTRTP